MSWILKGVDGPLKGEKFPVKPGLTLGRQGEVVVPDTKSSAIHARIYEDSDGTWYLADNNSKNGTRIDGERISTVELQDGLIFAIGDQKFEVVEIRDKKKPTPDIEITGVNDEPTMVERPPEPPEAPELRAPEDEVTRVASGPPPQEATAAPEPAAPEPAKRYWNDVLADFLEASLENFGERKRPVSALNPALVLEFVRGVQANSRWILGYGPRKVGAGSLDLPLFEPGVPGVCFEITPSPDGILFKTAHPNLVTVNGQSLDSRLLCVGDTIRIKETMIEVDFTE